jgi:hypothetical protein
MERNGIRMVISPRKLIELYGIHHPMTGHPDSGRYANTTKKKQKNRHGDFGADPTGFDYEIDYGQWTNGIGHIVCPLGQRNITGRPDLNPPKYFFGPTV